MGDLFGYILRLGIVRVSFVPILMGCMVYVLYVLAAPASGGGEDEQGHNA